MVPSHFFPLPLSFFFIFPFGRILARHGALKKLKGISSVPEVALFLLAGGEGRVESAGIIEPVHIVHCTTVSQYFIARTFYLSLSFSPSIFSTSPLSPFATSLCHPPASYAQPPSRIHPPPFRARELRVPNPVVVFLSSFLPPPGANTSDGFYDLPSVSVALAIFCTYIYLYKCVYVYVCVRYRVFRVIVMEEDRMKFDEV